MTDRQCEELLHKLSNNLVSAVSARFSISKSVSVSPHRSAFLNNEFSRPMSCALKKPKNADKA